jgi:hypothetical protein
LKRSPLAMLLLTTVTQTAVYAQQSEQSARFRAWWDRVTVVAGDNDSLDGVCIAYRVDMLQVPRADELARLRREVEGKPDHPARVQLSIYDRRLQLDGKDGDQRMVWRYKGMWRYNGQPLSDPEAYSDLVWGDGVAWGLSQNTLLLADPATAARHPYGLPGVSSNMTFELMALTGAGIGLAHFNSIRLIPVVSDGVRWTAQGGTPDGRLRVKANGTWSEETGWGTVDSVHTSDLWVKATEWMYCEPLGMGIAGRVDICDSDGKIDRRITLNSAVPFTPREFLAISRPPKIDGSDPIRGKTTFREVVDVRGSTPLLGHIQAGALVQLRSESHGREPEDRLRVLGWIIAASSIATLGVTWVRRRRYRATVS